MSSSDNKDGTQKDVKADNPPAAFKSSPSGCIYSYAATPEDFKAAFKAAQGDTGGEVALFICPAMKPEDMAAELGMTRKESNAGNGDQTVLEKELQQHIETAVRNKIDEMTASFQEPKRQGGPKE